VDIQTTTDGDHLCPNCIKEYEEYKKCEKCGYASESPICEDCP
jgi:predicted amidophosphoribosyltransferase